MNRSTLFCLILSLIFCALFVADTNGVFDRTKHPIAKVKESVRTVRRLPNDGLTWDRAREGTRLELGDTVSTGDRATVKIAFDSGATLTLDSGSMVVLAGDPEELHLNFLTGAAKLELTNETKNKIKVIQPSTKKLATKTKRIRSAVEVTLAEDGKQKPETAPAIKSELSDAPVIAAKVQIKSPELLSPKQNAHYAFTTSAKQNVAISWKGPSNIKTYHVYVEDSDGAEVFDEDVRDTKLTLQQLSPRTYHWSVYAVDDNHNYSDPSATFTFVVDDVPPVQWSDNSSVYLYTTPKPSLKLSWGLGTNSLKSPRFKVALKPSGESKELSFPSQSVSKIVDLPKDNFYDVRVELVSENGSVLSTSTVKTIEVKMRPLLPPPQFSERLPASIVANRNGSFALSWLPVRDAKHYVIQLKNDRDKFFKESKATSTSFTMHGLLPGDYALSVATVDQFERLGAFSKEKHVKVPNISDVKGPAFKKFEIR